MFFVANQQIRVRRKNLRHFLHSPKACQLLPPCPRPYYWVKFFPRPYTWLKCTRKLGEKFTPDLTIGREILSEWVSEWVFILRQKRVLLISKKLPQPTKKNSQNIHPLYPRHYKTLTFEDIINSQVPRPIVSRRTWLYYSPGPKIWRLMFIQAIWPGMVWYGMAWYGPYQAVQVAAGLSLIEWAMDREDREGP